MADQSLPLDSSPISGLPGHYFSFTANDPLWVLDTGDLQGTPAGTIVFLHSAVGNLGTFQHQVSAFARKGYRILAYDRRGHGRSPAPVAGTPQGSAQQDLATLLLDRGIADPIHLVGAAAGGRLAADFSIAHPDRVASLTLVCSLAGVAAEIYPQGTSALLPPEFLALPPYLRELGPVYRGDNPEGTAEWRDLVEGEIPKNIVSNPDAWVGKSSTEAVASGTATVKPRGVAGLAWLAEAGGATAKGIPLHLITGDADPYATPSAYRRLAQVLPSARLDIIPGSGHSPYWEQPEIFNATVLTQANMLTQGALN